MKIPQNFKFVSVDLQDVADTHINPIERDVDQHLLVRLLALFTVSMLRETILTQLIAHPKSARAFFGFLKYCKKAHICTFLFFSAAALSAAI